MDNFHPSPSMASGPGAAAGARPSILDLSPHVGREVLVKFQGGREVVGTLRGWDPLVNLVLENAVERRGATAQARTFDMVVCRGIAVSVVCPKDGFEEIPNPFTSGEVEE